jgi:hypothetical protein
MRHVVLATAAALAAASCTNEPMSYRELEDMTRRHQREAISRPEPDSCQMEAHRHLIGMDGAAVDQSSLPAGARVICHDCVVTMDYRADRLNVQLGPAGKVANLRCG